MRGCVPDSEALPPRFLSYAMAHSSTSRPLHPLLPSLRLALVVIALSVASATALGQGVWERPPENLQVLPEDIPPEQLRSIMFRFTQSLGVRCNHCHDDSRGPGFNNMDFVSDAKPAKDIARAMMRMSGTINAAVAEAVPGDREAVSVGCMTCHRGRPRPVMLEDLLAQTISTHDAAAAVEQYESLREEYRDGFSFDFRPETLIRLGEQLLEEGRTDDAITMLRLNTEHHPMSSSAFSALARAYAAKGETDLAEVFVHKALTLDPGNRQALQLLRGENP